MGKNYLFLFLIGALFGILISQFITPRLEASFLSKLKVSPQVSQNLPQENKIQIFCQEIQKGKGVEVDLDQQKVRMCENGKAIEEFRVSTGKTETPTPTGEFRVINKSPMLYSNLARSYMPFWIGFWEDYGFHELPISKENEKRIGEDKIGYPDSIGCIRLNVGDAERFYRWTEIGMRVIIFGKTS